MQMHLLQSGAQVSGMDLIQGNTRAEKALSYSSFLSLLNLVFLTLDHSQMVFEVGGAILFTDVFYQVRLWASSFFPFLEHLSIYCYLIFPFWGQHYVLVAYHNVTSVSTSQVIWVRERAKI